MKYQKVSLSSLLIDLNESQSVGTRNFSLRNAGNEKFYLQKCVTETKLSNWDETFAPNMIVKNFWAY